jgi:peptide/nickel transport system substrate-binding protein
VERGGLVTRVIALAAAVAVALLAVGGAGGTNAQTPRAGGTIRFGDVGEEPACLNVLVARCHGTSPMLGYLAEKVLEGAFFTAPDFTSRPRLVTGVSFTKRPPFTLTYRIHPRATWSDGVPITSRDFVFTLRAQIARKALLFDFDRALVTKVRSVRAVDAKTVRVVLRSRDAAWPELFGYVLPRHALAGQNLANLWVDGIVDPRTGRPIGSGPFLVQRWERGRELTLVRNPRYWGKRAYVDRLVLRTGLGGEPLEMLQKGELDIVWEFFPGSVPPLRRAAGIRVHAAPTNRLDHFAIRVGPGGHPALKNKLVRRALAYGLDRDALVRQVLGPVAPGFTPSQSLLFLRPSPRYRASFGAYRRRPDEARRLLERAGCRRGADGIYVCAGRRLSLRFVTSAGIPPRAQMIMLAQAQLRQVGIEVLPLFAPQQAFIGQILARGEFDVTLFAWTLDPGGVGLNRIYGCGGADNFTGYCQRLVTRDLDQANRIFDASQQARVLARADQGLARDVPAIPIHQIPLPAAHTTRVRGFVLSPVNPLTTAENWWLAR